VIQSFGDAATADIFHGRQSRTARRLPQAIWPVIRRKLDVLNAAYSLGDLRAPPGNRLEALKGERAGSYSIRVNDQYRITFRFADGDAHDVACEDYH
jgi:toxin HigB-1